MPRRTLREWRAYLNLDKQDIAKKLDIHPSTYASWEGCPERIRVCDIERIAKAFECEAHEIIFFEKNPSLKLGFLKEESRKGGQSVRNKLETEVSA